MTNWTPLSLCLILGGVWAVASWTYELHEQANELVADYAKLKGRDKATDDENAPEDFLEVRPSDLSANTKGRIFVGTPNKADIAKVSGGFRQLKNIWDEDHELFQACLYIPETYEHIAKLPDLEYLSADWLWSVAAALEQANTNKERLEQEIQEIKKLDPLLTELEEQIKRKQRET